MHDVLMTESDINSSLCYCSTTTVKQQLKDSNWFLKIIQRLPSVLWRCWLGGRKGIPPVKNGGWWRWAMVSPDGVAPIGVSYLPLLIFPCTIKSRSSLLAPAHPGGPGKRAVKRLWWYRTETWNSKPEPSNVFIWVSSSGSKLIFRPAYTWHFCMSWGNTISPFSYHKTPHVYSLPSVWKQTLLSLQWTCASTKQWLRVVNVNRQISGCYWYNTSHI